MRQCERSGKRFNLDYIDPREALDIAGIEYSESGKNIGRNYIGIEECPFCQKGNNHLGVRVDAPVFNCFSCGTKGNLLKLFAKILGFGEALEKLADATPKELKEKLSEIRERAVHVELPKDCSTEITAYHAGYLISRGFDYEELCNNHNLHFTGPAAEIPNAIVVPFVKRNKLTTYTTISIADDVAIRYLHLPEEESILSVKEQLYGIDETDGNSCIVVEGIFDKFRIGEGCVCSFGTRLSEIQFSLLRKFSRVVILMDGDIAGMDATAEIVEELSGFVSEIIPVYLDDGVDPDIMDPKDIIKVRELIGK